MLQPLERASHLMVVLKILKNNIEKNTLILYGFVNIYLYYYFSMANSDLISLQLVLTF